MIYAANGTNATLIDNCFSGNTVTGLVYIETDTGAFVAEASGNYQSGNIMAFPCPGFVLGSSFICAPFDGTSSCRGASMGDDMVSITDSPSASPSAGPHTSPSAAPQLTTTTTDAPVAATVTDAPVASPSGSPTPSPSAGPNVSPSAAPQVTTTTTGAPVAATVTDAPVASPTVSAGFQARTWKISASGTMLFGAVFVMMCM